MMLSPVETPRTATAEAAWPIRDTYHSFGNANSDVVVVLSQGGPLPGLVQEVADARLARSPPRQGDMCRPTLGMSELASHIPLDAQCRGLLVSHPI